ncbi:TetR/AcrR family transcriptional regulator C-terminal domain-containing protein [Actinomadura miaoliensis]|uniref:TetR/AcrR family transcriptional regulator n=1 Tax=Actinomadura miaoliensis TaxID=430685 RepID=A0ABP7VRX3_9ACTN
MTKKQAGRPSGTRLTAGAVVRAALEVLDDTGWEGVSTRAIADRLGVRMNTVLWHVKSKARLRELMADAIVGEISLDDLPGPWDERVTELARRYRRALLAHRDGALVVAGTYVPEPGTLRFAEALVAALLDSGAAHRDVAWTAWTIIYLALGLVQEEQGAEDALVDRLAQAVSATAYPALHEVLGHMDRRFDERFEFGLSLLLDPLHSHAV